MTVSSLKQSENTHISSPGYSSIVKTSNFDPFNLTFIYNRLNKNISFLFTKTLIHAIQTIGGIEKLILPALEMFKNHRKKIFLIKLAFCGNSDNQASSVSLKTKDNVLLDGVIIWSHRKDYKSFQNNRMTPTFKNQKWVIFFNGNGMCYEQLLPWAKAYSQEGQCNLLLFNYRGVANSQGYPKTVHDLVLDGDAAIQFLLDRSIPSSSIVIHGLSLGGAIGAQVRALHPDGPIVNEKSFSSIASLVESLLYRNFKKSRYQKYFAKYLSSMIGVQTRNVLKQTKWELNTQEIWAKIRGYKWIISCTKDELIQGQGKLYKALKRQIRLDYPAAAPSFLQEKLNALNHIKSLDTGHCDLITDEAKNAHLHHLKKALSAP